MPAFIEPVRDPIPVEHTYIPYDGKTQTGTFVRTGVSLLLVKAVKYFFRMQGRKNAGILDSKGVSGGTDDHFPVIPVIPDRIGQQIPDKDLDQRRIHPEQDRLVERSMDDQA